MSTSNLKGKGKAAEQDFQESIAANGSEESFPGSDEETDEEITKEYLNSLLEKAKAEIAVRKEQRLKESKETIELREEEEIVFGGDEALPCVDYLFLVRRL